MSIWQMIAAIAIIFAFSALLVFVDPLTLVADWLDDRRYCREREVSYQSAGVEMSDGAPEGYVRKRARPHRWCSGRPTECHVRPLEGRGDIWVCPECKQVWIGVLRPSLLDAVPHWAIKWKRMCPPRAAKWAKRAD